MIRPATNGTDQTVCRTDTNSTPTQVCIKCNRRKPLTAFAVDRSRPNGRRNTCAECRADYESMADYRRRSHKYGHEPVMVPFTRSQVTERYGDRCYYCPFARRDGRVRMPRSRRMRGCGRPPHARKHSAVLPLLQQLETLDRRRTAHSRRPCRPRRSRVALQAHTRC